MRSVVAAVALLATVAAAGELPPITPTRYDEHYPRPDPLKHIPLDPRGDAYLTLGGEVRLRHESYVKNNFGTGPQDDDGYLWLRVMPYADLHAGQHLRFFGELISAFEFGDDFGLTPIDENRADLLQGFAELHAPDNAFTLRAGRQMLRYGSERLISVRYGPNVPRSFDAILARVVTSRWKVDAFYARPAANSPGEFDDRTSESRSLWSLYATAALPELGRHAGVDVYYIGSLDRDAEFTQGDGRDLRHTLGVRLFGRRGDFDFDVEAFYQFGTFDGPDGDGAISAYSVAADVGYTFSGVPLSPRLELKLNTISGDDDRDDATLQTFNPLYPRGKYFGELALLGPSNLFNIHAAASVELSERLELELASVFYWRASRGDGIYDPGGSVLRDDPDADARFIGTQLELSANYTFSRELELSATAGVFLPGRYLDETGEHECVYFVGLELLYRF
jgi:hypothetical protein